MSGACDPEVLIVGAGPVGLTLAVALRLEGAAVRVVDKAPHAGAEPRAAVVWPRGRALLARLGAGAAFDAAGLPIRSTEVWSGGRRLGRLTFGQAAPPPLAIEQHDTERLLIARLEALDVAVERSREAVAVRQDAGGVSVDLRRPDGSTETARARWVVGCDGAHSAVRKLAGIDFPGRPRRNLQVLQGNVGVEGLPLAADGGRVFLKPGLSLSLYPMPGGHRRLFAFAVDPDPDDAAAPTAESLQRLLAEASGAPVRLTAAEPAWFGRARFQERTAARFRDGRVLLCGDAAHVWAPVGGHGMNAGLYGAGALAPALARAARDEADAAGLDAWAQAQRRTIRRVKALSRLDLIEQPPSRLRLAVLRRALPPLLDRPAVGRLVERAISGVAAPVAAA